jgi:hypothetical protein
MVWRDGESKSGDVLENDEDKMAVMMMMTMTMMTKKKKCSGRLQPKRSIMYNKKLSDGRNTRVLRNDVRNECTICKRRWIMETLSSTWPDW